MIVEMSVDLWPPKDWDSFLLRSPRGSIYQSTFYARYALSTGASFCRYVRFFADGELFGQLLLVRYSPINVRVSQVTLRASRSLGVSPLGVYRWQYGPVCTHESVGDKVATEIAGAIAKYCGHASIETSTLPLQSGRNIVEDFRRAGFGILLSHTVIIDLSKPVSQLWASLDKDSARWAVMRARKRSVDVDFAKSEEDLKQFYLVLTEARSRAGLPQYQWEHIRDLWRIMEPAGILRLVVARHDGKMIAGLMTTCFNGVTSAFRAANSIYNIQRRLCANDLIQWFVIEHGSKSGQRLYDLSGISLSAEQKAVGITRFKSKWGGAITAIPAVRRNVAHLDALRDLWQKVKFRYDKSICDKALG